MRAPARLLQWLYVLGVGAVLYGLLSRWVYDDPFITYRYADNLAHGLGFVYNPGEQVLSTTSPLLAMVLAVGALVGVDLQHMANLIGALSLALGGLCLWKLAKTWEAPLVGWAGLLLYPSFPLVLSTLSSETPLYVALCLGTMLFYTQEQYSAAALLAGLCTLARPDGILVALVLGAHLVISRRFRLWNAAFVRPALILAVILLAWAAFAWPYFGSPLPVTLAAKQHQGAMTINLGFLDGASVVIIQWYNAWHYWLEAAFAVMGLVVAIWWRRGWWMLFAWTGVYFAAYALLGVSSYFWYYAPLVPGFIVLVGLGLEGPAHIRRPAFAGRVWRWLAVGLLLVLVGVQIGVVWRAQGGVDRRYQIYRAVGEWLAMYTPPDATVGALEVGIMGFYAHRSMVDFAGLIQPDVGAQMATRTTYEDTVRWAIGRYGPDYLVLPAGLYPQLEKDAVTGTCRIVQYFEAGAYEAERDMAVYYCP